MGKIYQLIAAASFASVLAWGGIGGFLVATGKLHAEAVGQIARILQGLPPTEPCATQPAATSQPSEDDGPPTPVRSAEELAAQRRHDHMQSLRLERAQRDIESRLALLRQAQLALVQNQEAFERKQHQWEEQRRKLIEKARDEGFERELTYVTTLPPKLAKEHLLRTWQKQPIDAVRLLNAMPSAKGKRILEQFKTAEELELAHQLLEQVRLQQAELPDAESGKTAAPP
jgi:hypothetical protein